MDNTHSRLHKCTRNMGFLLSITTLLFAIPRPCLAPQSAGSHFTYHAGPIVRISPYELHVLDSTFYEKLYFQEGHWNKYAWSIDAFTAPGASIWTPPHHIHRARRLPLNAYFSKAKVASQQDVVRRNVDKFCARISGFEGKSRSVDLGAATSAFTRDVAIEYILGRKHNSLEKEDFNAVMTTVFQDSRSMWRLTKHVRWFGPFIFSLPIDWVIKTADEGTKALLLYVKAGCPFDLSRPPLIIGPLGIERVYKRTSRRHSIFFPRRDGSAHRSPLYSRLRSPIHGERVYPRR
jgi:hypothetical protein